MERLTRILAALTRWGLGLCALVLVLMALYVSLGRELTPLVAEYRAEVEAKASAALGMPLNIGELEGNWSGFAPIMLAHDVMVGEGANALRLDQVRAVPDLWASLMAREVRIAHLELSGLKISLKEGEDGALGAGRFAGAAGSAAGSGAIAQSHADGSATVGTR